MGFLWKLLKSGKQGRCSKRLPQPFGANDTFRTCRFEQMEPRRLLAADPILFGAVYFEDRSGQDQEGDVFTITWSGGAEETQLTELVIEGDKLVDGLTGGDTFFDTEPGGLGVYEYFGLTIVENSGIDSISSILVDGGTSLSLVFDGFDAGDRLVLAVDVDEYRDPADGGTSAFAEGAEFEGALLTATFIADHYYDALETDVFQDVYVVTAGLDLPNDDYMPPSTVPVPIQTAGVMLGIQQTPLPISISGTVFNDWDLSNSQEPGEPGIPGVTLSLFIEEGGLWVDTGATAVTNAVGDYRFDNLLPGTYRIVETQPGGYLSVGATAGTVNGATRGVVITVDEIANIALLGGEDSVDNDFAETQPVQLSGYVYHDVDNDGVREPGEEGIGGVWIRVPDRSPGAMPGATISTTTNSNGYWEITGLFPGEYWVAETQPAGFIDGLDTAGTAGGTAHNPGDLIDRFQLVGGQSGREYNFGEFHFASISGHVYNDANDNGIFDPGEIGIPGATVTLFDDAGTPLQSTVTDAAGFYLFDSLAPGTYRLVETQPDGYLDGIDRAGSAGGIAHNPGDEISDIPLISGTDARDYDFGEVVPASISGYVFQDGPTIQVGIFDPLPNPANVRNGQLTPDDTAIAGVVLQLGNFMGAPVLGTDGQPITTVSDANGYYQFTNLRAGVYTVYEVHPNGYVDSIDTPGSNGGQAFNPHDPPDPLSIMLFAGDHQNDAITRILVESGDQATDYNFSEVVYNRDSIIFPKFPDPLSPPVAPPAPLPPAPASGQFYNPLPPQIVIQAMFIGSGGPDRYTWHLSVVNGGQPRRMRTVSNTAIDPTNPYFNPKTWTGRDMNQGRWIFADSNGVVQKKLEFGLPDAIPVAGDFNGDGVDEIGIYLDGVWFVDLNANGVWDRSDFWAKLGRPGDMPVVGDWDGDGKTDIGTFGPAWNGDTKAINAEPGLPTADNTFKGKPKNVPPEPEEATVGWRVMKRTAKSKLRSDLIDHVFEFGIAGDRPMAGDFNGDGVATIAIFRGGVWYLDMDGDGRWSKGDLKVNLGRRGDIPVIGDFNEDGIDDLGVYRAGVWHLDTNGNRRLDAHDKVFHLGGPRDLPVVGDFDGDGADEIAVYQNKGTDLPSKPVQQQETAE